MEEETHDILRKYTRRGREEKKERERGGTRVKKKQRGNLGDQKGLRGLCRKGMKERKREV